METIIICERCQNTFHCNADNITECECSRIKLTAKELEYMSDNYKNCICKKCLIEIKKQAKV
jgi:hypothetical protein